MSFPSWEALTSSLHRKHKIAVSGVYIPRTLNPIENVKVKITACTTTIRRSVSQNNLKLFPAQKLYHYGFFLAVAIIVTTCLVITPTYNHESPPTQTQ